jgi:hypothetical protein
MELGRNQDGWKLNHDMQAFMFDRSIASSFILWSWAVLPRPCRVGRVLNLLILRRYIAIWAAICEPCISCSSFTPVIRTDAAAPDMGHFRRKDGVPFFWPICESQGSNSGRHCSWALMIYRMQPMESSPGSRFLSYCVPRLGSTSVPLHSLHLTWCLPPTLPPVHGG